MDVKEDLKCLSLCMDDIGDKVLFLQFAVQAGHESTGIQDPDSLKGLSKFVSVVLVDVMDVSNKLERMIEEGSSQGKNKMKLL